MGLTKASKKSCIKVRVVANPEYIVHFFFLTSSHSAPRSSPLTHSFTERTGPLSCPFFPMPKILTAAQGDEPNPAQDCHAARVRKESDNPVVLSLR
jgi:hypothetical protein